MPSLGPTELIIILVLAIVLFGAGKVGEIGGALGKSIREFRHAANDEDARHEPAHPVPPTVRHCPSCGKAAAEGDQFCSSCGAKLDPSAA